MESEDTPATEYAKVEAHLELRTGGFPTGIVK